MLALGYTTGLIKKLFTPPGPLEQAKSQTEPLLYSSHLYYEYRMAKSLGMTHGQFSQLPRRERRTWYYYFILESEKEAYGYEKAKKDAETNAASKAPSRQPRHR